MNLSPDQWVSVIQALATGAGIWTAIRVDIKAIHQRIDYLYKRIDEDRPIKR